MNVGGVGTEQPGAAHLAQFAVLAGRTAADVNADANAQFASEGPIVFGHFERGELRAAGSQGQCEELVIAGKILLGDALDVVRMLEAAVVPPRLHVEVGIAVGENAAHARLVQRRNGRVGMLRRVLDVRPVEQRGDARVDRAQRADQVSRVGVLGAIHRRENPQNVLEIFIEQRVGGDVAQDTFPDMAVRIDESRHDDPFGGVDHLRVLRAQIRPDRRNFRALDEDIGLPEVTDRGIQREHAPVLQKSSFD